MEIAINMKTIHKKLLILISLFLINCTSSYVTENALTTANTLCKDNGGIKLILPETELIFISYDDFNLVCNNSAQFHYKSYIKQANDHQKI